jgi:PAS domain S-box-containing protein
MNEDKTRDSSNAMSTSQRKFETVFEHANDAIFIVDIENDSIVDCNPAAEELVEYSREELMEMPASNLHPHNLSEFMNFADRVLEHGEGWTDDITCYCKSGDIIPAEMSASVVEIDGRPHLVNHIRETTDRAEREWFEALIEHSGDFITVIKADGTIRYQSSSIDHLLGYTPDEIRNESILDYVHPDDKPTVETILDEVTASSGLVTQQFEYRFRRADGSWAWLESHGSYRPDSAITGYVINSREITQRKESQQQAAVLHRILRHNLRNKLTIIRGNAGELLREESETVVSKAETILDHALELSGMAEETRVMSNILESPDVQQQRHNLTATVETEIKQLREAHPDVVFECDLPTEQEVFAAPRLTTAIKQVLVNAVEHNDADSPRVTVSAHPPAAGEEYVTVVVADNGPGIPEQERATLVEGEERQLQHGSGIGLWIVNWIITRSGGQLAFEENEPRGSRVILMIPAADPSTLNGERHRGE